MGTQREREGGEGERATEGKGGPRESERRMARESIKKGSYYNFKCNSLRTSSAAALVPKTRHRKITGVSSPAERM